MAISPYLKGIREKVGHELLLVPSATALVRDGNQLLLVRPRGRSSWTLPGGIIDPGESPAETVLRETWEETGIIVRPKRIIAVFGGSEGFGRTYPNGDQVEFVDTLFECAAVGGSLQCRDDEAVEARYFMLAEAATLSFMYPVPLNTLLSGGATTRFHWDDRWLESLQA